MRLLSVLPLLFACAPKTPPLPAPAVASPGPPPGVQAPKADPTPAEHYADALADARYPLPSKVVDDLLVIDDDTEGLSWQDGQLLVYTLSRSSYYDDPKYVPGHEFALYGDTWFTSGTQVFDACEGLESPELDLRLEQLLGLPPDGGRDIFLEVWIDPEELVRPCADPDITASSCPVDTPIQADGNQVSWSCSEPKQPLTEHQQYLCNTWVDRYGSSDPMQQYPWTALGYTFDWAHLDNPVGPSEFVAESGTSVAFESATPIEDFCASPSP